MLNKKFPSFILILLVCAIMIYALTTSIVVITSDSGSTSAALVKDNLTVTTITNDASTKANITDWRNESKSYARGNWPFEGNTSGNNATRDFSTNGATLTKGSAIVWKQNGKSGGFYNWSTAVGDGRELLSFTGIASGTNFTISMFIRPTTLGSAYQTLFGLANPDGLFFTGSTDKLNVRWGGADHASTKTVTINNWNHVVLRNSNKKCEFFINGVLDASSYTSCPKFTFTGLGHVSGGDVWNGGIDSAMLFLTNLSVQQILLLNLSSPDILSAAQTRLGQNWSARVCPSNTNTIGFCKWSNNITVVASLGDTIKPAVFDKYPRNASVYNITNKIIVSVNVTDDVSVSQVFANLTRPGGIFSRLQLKLSTTARYGHI